MAHDVGARLASVRPVTVATRDLGVLDEVLAELRAIRVLLEQRQQPPSPPTLSREDRGRLSRLLPAVGATLGSELFTSSDLVEHESAALRVVCVDLTAKQLGRLLRRAAGTPIGGYLVERQGVEAGAVLWRVVAVPEFPQNGKVSVPHAPQHELV